MAVAQDSRTFVTIGNVNHDVGLDLSSAGQYRSIASFKFYKALPANTVASAGKLEIQQSCSDRRFVDQRPCGDFGYDICG